jgi:hypothetical protein
MCKISLKSKLGFLTVLFSLMTVSFLMAIFGVGIVQSGLQQTSCNATNDNCVNIDCADDFVVLTRPFRIDVSYNAQPVRMGMIIAYTILISWLGLLAVGPSNSFDSFQPTAVSLLSQYSDQLVCGWATPNTVFRSIVCWIVATAGITALVALKYGSQRAMFWVMIGYLLSAVSMISVLTLDANSVRVGLSYCKNKAQLGAGFHKGCSSNPMIGLCAAEAAAALMLWFTYLITKSMYKVLKVLPGRPPRGRGKPAKMDSDEPEEEFTGA